LTVKNHTSATFIQTTKQSSHHGVTVKEVTVFFVTHQRISYKQNTNNYRVVRSFVALIRQ